MNALVQLIPDDDALLAWLVSVAGSSCRVRDVAQRFGVDDATASARVQKLRYFGLVERGRGNCEPTGMGVARIRLQETRRQLGDPMLDPAPEPSKARRLDPLAPACDTIPSPPMETRVSIVGQPLDELVAKLAAFQDPLLTQANALLRLRVTELEDEVQQLRASLIRARELLTSFAKMANELG